MATGLFNLKQVNQAISQGAWSGYIAPKWVEYLVVAGGGTGRVGGGGAGGLLTGIVTVAAGTSYTVTVGAGGSGGGTSWSFNTSTSGNNSVFGSITSTGGGLGGNYAGVSGGSGGGGGAPSGDPTVAGGQGVSGQGNAGGSSYTNAGTSGSDGGGGGGAGTVGLSAPPVTGYGGNGGAGIASSITGTVVTYAGGGGGGGYVSAGVGGVGGGGTGAINAGTALYGSANSGGGGGGAAYATGSNGSGGSGIVVVRYPGSIQFFTGGTLSYANGYMIHTFYSSGTLAPTTPTPYVTSYQISRSLRFNQPDSTYLSRTPASASNRKTYTWSGWVKRSSIGTGDRRLFEAGVSSTNVFWFGFGNDSSTDQFLIQDYSGGFGIQLGTTALYRDVSAWYHVVVAIDTTQATSTDRVKLYINGVQVTSFSGTTTYPSQNYETRTNQAVVHDMGGSTVIGGTAYYNGYITEVNFIDGQALTPSSFGYTNPATGVWSPLAFVGTYGTNGFYLNFSDNSNTTAATLGKDYSGNGNNWTPNNFSVTAGAGNDSLVDSPTSYGTDTGVGGEVRGNYATLNPLSKGSACTLSNGNLDLATTNQSGTASATIGVTSGKWYWECTLNTGTTTFFTGLVTSSHPIANYIGQGASSWGYYSSNGQKWTNGSGAAYGSSYTNGDVIGVAFDADAGTLTFYKNNTSQGTAFTGLTSGPYFPASSDAGNGSNSTTSTFNFGQRPFAYTAPSGYKALCTQNLPTPTIGATTATQAGKYFNPVLYTGNGSSRSITGLGFQPDFTWIKARSVAYSHRLADSVRGAGKELYSDDTAAEVTNSANGYVTSFDSDGFSLGTGIGVNANTQTFVAWNWKANGSGSTNTAGSITSTVSANTTSGFSVVTYTGTANASDTVGHGLGSIPSMILVKNRTTSATNWIVYNSNISVGATPANQCYLLLNTTAAAGAANLWNATSPTSSVFSISNNSQVNGSANNFVAYCFAPVSGYSAFGSWTGNGSADGPFVFTGFKPAYILWKRTDSSAGGDWGIVDATRNPSNVVGEYLAADTSGAGATYSMLDMVSNGFKIRWSDTSTNASGGTYIYMAFASAPFKFSLGR